MPKPPSRVEATEREKVPATVPSPLSVSPPAPTHRRPINSAPKGLTLAYVRANYGDETCVACAGKGKATNNTDCVPCEGTGRKRIKRG